MYVSNSSGLAGQVCRVDGVELTSGQSHLFYKARTASDCHAISQNRRCNAGKLDGSDLYLVSSCLEVIGQAEAYTMVVQAMISDLGRTQAEAVADNEGIAFWVGQLRQGLTQAELKTLFQNSDEYYIRGLYRNILKRNASMTEIKYYLTELATKRMTRTSIAQHFNYVCNNKLEGECGGIGEAPKPIDFEATVLGAMIHALGRTLAEAQADTAGISYWVQRLKSGYSVSAMSSDMRSSDEYYVRQAYKTILKRNPEMSEVQYYVNEIKARRMTRSSVTQHLQYVCNNKIGGECR